MFQFIHAADIHLDSPLLGLERYEGAPVEGIRGATREALKRLVTLAIQENVAFVLIVGDLYDGACQDQVMYYQLGPGEVKSVLQDGDIAGIQVLYGP